MAKHWVSLVELLDPASDNLYANAKFFRQFLLLLTFMRHKLVKRRVNQADRDRKAVHGLKDADEVAALERQQAIESLDASLFVVGQDHFLDGALALVTLLRELKVGEEHVLGAAKTDTLGAKFACLARILRSVSIGANTELSRFIGPLHECFVGLGQLRNNKWKRVGVHNAFAAIQGDPIPFSYNAAIRGHGQRFVVDVQFLGSN